RGVDVWTLCLFFFSSRRRHTRLVSDWSSDVCSSDLFGVEGAGDVSALLLLPTDAKWILALAHGAGAGMAHPFMSALADELARVRSEERRVGKEWRSRWATWR